NITAELTNKESAVQTLEKQLQQSNEKNEQLIEKANEMSYKYPITPEGITFQNVDETGNLLASTTGLKTFSKSELNYLLPTLRLNDSMIYQGTFQIND